MFEGKDILGIVTIMLTLYEHRDSLDTERSYLLFHFIGAFQIKEGR
jgi:hypothetical protein